MAGFTPAEALERAGGMGRFQWFFFFTGILCHCLSGYFYYNLSYLELFPKKSEVNKVEIFPYICYTSNLDTKGYGCLQEEACKLSKPAYFEAN
jgi:hypothetical protein